MVTTTQFVWKLSWKYKLLYSVSRKSFLDSIEIICKNIFTAYSILEVRNLINKIQISHGFSNFDIQYV